MRPYPSGIHAPRGYVFPQLTDPVHYVSLDLPCLLCSVTLKGEYLLAGTNV